MWKKLIVVTVLLLLFQRSVCGSTPLALDIYNQIYHLQPGANVKVAYDILGNPQENTGSIGIFKGQYDKYY